MKAKEKSTINEKYRYLVIPDTEIKNKTFNSVFFELAKNNNSNINFRIIQASKPYQIEKNTPLLNSSIFINPKDKTTKEIPTFTKELKNDDGFLIKNGTIKTQENNIYALITQNTNNKENQIYAVIVESWLSE